MPTASEYRCEAKSCLELANRTNELYVKDALTELALEKPAGAFPVGSHGTARRCAFEIMERLASLARL
jgi:hypothetical protein